MRAAASPRNLLARPEVFLPVAGAWAGLVAWYLLELWPKDELSPGALLPGALGALVAFVAVFHFAWTGAFYGRLLLLAAGTAALLGAVTVWVWGQIPPADSNLLLSGGVKVWFAGDASRTVTWRLALLIVLYVLGPFIQIYQRSGRWRFPYPELFLHSWSNFHIGLVAVFFLGALWAVLFLWGSLFDLIGVNFFAELFKRPTFAWMASGGALAYGVFFAKERQALIATLRAVTLGLMRTLLPLVAAAALLFVLSVPFQGLDLLWKTDRASLMLLSWTTLMIALLNAVYQDGVAEPPYIRPVRLVVAAGLFVLPAFAGIALYGLSLRIDQYGLTISRTMGLVVAVVLGLYTLGYCAAVLRRSGGWLDWVRPVNMCLAILVVVLALLLHTPVLDPLRLSAESQYQRLAEGRVKIQDFDFGYLRFKLGRAGAVQLVRLRALAERPGGAELRAALDNLLTFKTEPEWRQELMHSQRVVDSLPAAEFLPDGLVDAIIKSRSSLCEKRNEPCRLLRIKLSDAIGSVYVIFPGASYAIAGGEVFAEIAPRTWQHLGNLVNVSPDESEDRSKWLPQLDSAITAGDYGTVEPQYPDLRIGQKRFRLLPGRDPIRDVQL